MRFYLEAEMESVAVEWKMLQECLEANQSPIVGLRNKKGVGVLHVILRLNTIKYW